VPRGELPPLIVICGPTATGKTGLSLELAARLPAAEIISADSRQVYRGMDIGTAKVDTASRARVPHHGLDLVDPDEAFTAADYRRHGMRVLGDIASRGGTAILVGGTGLFVKAIAEGVPLDEAGFEPAVRASLEARLASEGLEPLVAELRARAPGVAGSIDLANPRRVVRALERVAVHGDRPPPAPRGYPNTVEWHILLTEPAEHARRIAERARWQFANGLLEEAEALRARYPADLRAFSAVGYREAFDVLADRASVEEAIDHTILRTRQYAGRQRTWFRQVQGNGRSSRGRPMLGTS
jgi:tRNA dimethylallyltransferase